LRDAIAAATVNGGVLAIALIDLDHFKEINDTLGHDAGDELLKIVAGRLQEVVGGGGIIARLGGDEFAVLIEAEGCETDIPTALQSIERAVTEPIELALQQVAGWTAAGLAFGRVAVNVTSADFSFGCFATRFKNKLDAYGVPAHKVCVEVTERVFLGSGTQHVGEALERLEAMGVEIALDDFGTGYASLSHIKAYPIDRLKIDRSFVKDMQDNKDNLSIVQAITQLGRSLGLKITAEGVEREDQMVLLRGMGCGSLQGYYFSRPMPESDVRTFLSPESHAGVRVA
jgi:predicted signal transduction protein with EAL and GGDEF domain